MKVVIKRSFIYDRERFKEAERLTKEIFARVILRELQKENENSQTQHLEVDDK